jgi:hypothetical protein
MWSQKSHVETFQMMPSWNKPTVLKRNHIVRTCFYVCMYVMHVCMYVYYVCPYQTHKTTKSQINLGLGRNPKSWCYLKQKLVRINCVTEEVHTLQPILIISTECLMEVLPQWNKKGWNEEAHHFHPFQSPPSAWWRCYLNETKKLEWTSYMFQFPPSWDVTFNISIHSGFFKSNKI